MSAGTTMRTEQPMRHGDWMTAATEEYRRLGELLAGLSDEEWRRPTDCSEWDVHDMVAHLVGAAESTASIRELLRQARLGRRLRPGEPGVDGMNAVQVRDRTDARPQTLIHDLAAAGRRGVRARSRIPAPLRALPVPFGPPLGTRTLGYLMDRIYTRDAWLHRVDLARATGRPLPLTPEHDGRIVADIVAEWSRRHGRPYTLTLTGPAGGRFRAGSGAETQTVDAVEFVRILTGRAEGPGILRHKLPL